MTTTPTKIGKHQLVRFLRREGKMEYWVAERSGTSGAFTAKIPTADYRKNLQIARSLRSEFDVASSWEHENLLRIVAFEKGNGIACLITESFKGVPLTQLLRDKERQLASEAILNIMVQACNALHFIHDKGYVHANLKPSNFLIGEDSILKLKDFTLASRFVGRQPWRWIMRGTVLGTPGYIPPEQIRHEKLTPAADIYGLGCVFFEILERKPLFTGTSQNELLKKHLNVKAPRLTTADISPIVTDLITHMLAKQPNERPDLKLVMQGLLQCCQRMPNSNVAYQNVLWAAEMSADSPSAFNRLLENDGNTKSSQSGEKQTPASRSRISKAFARIQAVEFSWLSALVVTSFVVFCFCVVTMVHGVGGDLGTWSLYRETKALSNRAKHAFEAGKTKDTQTTFGHELEKLMTATHEMQPKGDSIPRELIQLKNSLTSLRELISRDSTNDDQGWDRINAHLESARDELQKRSHARISDALNMNKFLTEEVVTRNLIVTNTCFGVMIAWMIVRRLRMTR